MGVNLYSGRQYGRCRTEEFPRNSTFWAKSETNLNWCGEDGLNTCDKGEICGVASEYGIKLEDDIMISDSNFNLANFDNVPIALFSVFQVITLDSWTIQLYGMMNSSNPALSAFFFCSLVVIGNFFLLNIVLAVII
jgi:hypothetical protein